MSTVKRASELADGDIIRVGDAVGEVNTTVAGDLYVIVGDTNCYNIQPGWHEVLREARPVVTDTPPTAGYLPHPISFRVTDDQFQLAHALRSTFPKASWGEAFRWLLADPDVRALIGRRVRGD